ncbi:hypothetical protein [Lichenifustis flavocetrariae]|uniref:Uncharacterized protein n=1 Tax=Lichenifustis flavocetrariae TaxID=2949735 RepID=A0AA42CM59_9HYPH|nr:hypothetical protein [Lichenifustis flavocetrariae]MCW6512213.1 hypothetical protein [Lichenifustis flavocetrariae]
MIVMMRLIQILVTGTAVLSSSMACADGPFARVTGRRDPRVIVIDIAKALDPANDGTQKAIISRIRITPDVPAIDPSRLDAKYIGVNHVPGDALSNNIVISAGGKAYVVDHAGISRPVDVESGMPHGYPGAVTVLYVKKALGLSNNDTIVAIEAILNCGSPAESPYCPGDWGRQPALFPCHNDKS